MIGATMIDFSFTVIHALIYTVIFSTFTLSTLFINPRIWLHDYPDKIKKIAPVKTEKEKKQSVVLSVFFILIFMGYPIITLFLHTKMDNNTRDQSRRWV